MKSNLAVIGEHVMSFVNDHMNQEFHMEEMRQFIYSQLDGYVAPASPDRILRQLRQDKRLNYVVVNRKNSLYRVLPLVEAA